jgi:hypothetical protein
MYKPAFLLVSAVAAWAAQPACGEIIELLGNDVFDDWIHIGDSTPSGWPSSVGAEWTTAFSLTASQATGDATLQFDHIEADPGLDGIFVNDLPVGFVEASDGVIDHDPYDYDQWVTQILVIPAADLEPGVNTLRFEAGVAFPGSSFPLDDFLLKNMTVSVVPAPAAVAVLALWGMSGRRRRRDC